MVKRILACLVLLSALGVASTQASTISISPVSTSVNINDPFSIDIFASVAAGEVIAGVYVDLFFNQAIIQGTSFTIDPDGTMAPTLDLSGGFGAGGTSPLNLNYFTLQLDPIALAAAEGAAPFRIASVSFKALANGLSPLTLTAIPAGQFFSDFLGDNVLVTQVTNGSVCVGGAANCVVAENPVPEPATLALLGSGIGAVIMRRRRRQQGK